MHHRLHGARHEGREPGQVLGHAPRFRDELVLFDQARDQTDGERPFRIDRLAHQHHLHRPAAPDDPRQPRRRPAPGNDAELAFRRGEARVRRGDAQIAAKRHFQPTSHADAVDGRDGRLRRPLQLLGQTLHDGFERLAEVPMRHLGEIRAGSKGPPTSPGDGDDLDTLVLGRRPCRILKLGQRRQGDGIVLLWPVDRDQRHRPIDGIENLAVAQEQPPTERM